MRGASKAASRLYLHSPLAACREQLSDHCARKSACYVARMIYFVSFLAVAAVSLAIAGYGGDVAAEVLDRPERRRALA